MYFEIITQMQKTLGQLDKWLEAATTFAKSRPYDPNVLLDFRLAPDQFPLARQVRAACDTAKFAASRLSGKEPPVHPDTEKTMEELHARVRSVLEYLGTYRAEDFASAATRVISLPYWEGKTMNGADYLREHVVPNFYFHATHAYAILRHGGVNLGKRDFLGNLTMKSP